MTAPSTEGAGEAAKDTAAGESSAAFPFTFVTREVSEDLRRFVASIWFARGTVPYQRERIAPTGSTVAIVVLGDPLRQVPDNGEGVAYEASKGLIAGPHDRPIINEPLGETHAVGVVATPVGCETLFGCRPSALRGRVLPLTRWWPPAADLRNELMGSTDPQLMLARTEQVLRDGFGSEPDGLERCEAALELLEDDPRRPVADIADQLAIPHNRLNRDFNRIVGVSPRTMSSLLRIRRLLAELNVWDPIDWSTVAAEWGWYDQAHLIRDFNRYTGVTPLRYIEAQRSYLSDGQSADAVGFVPET